MRDNASGLPAPGPDLTIAVAAEQRSRLLSLLEASPAATGALQLDLSGVTDIDSAGVQLLLATQRSLAARGRALQLQAPSAAVRDALATFGLGAALAASPAA